MAENLMLDFSHICFEDPKLEKSGLRYIDLSDIGGTDMYCTKEAADEIRRRLVSCTPGGIHFLDNGNYHYATLFFLEKIREPFSLVLIDHHTDMQKPMLAPLVSCGSWAGKALCSFEYLKQMILIGPERKSMELIDEKLRDKLICITTDDIVRGRAEDEIGKIDLELPIYISLDKDVLSACYARTNWNQGEMSMDILKKLLLEIFVHQKVIGVDICGECSFQEPLPQLAEDTKVNIKANQSLYRYLIKLFGFQKHEIFATMSSDEFNKSQNQGAT
ncbi:MAG: arginase family protein [Ruminococcus sp.]|jgi:arginase family enzyme